MKFLALFLLLALPAFAQWIVNDPINTSVNMSVQSGQVANHIEIMRQWAQQLESLNRQLRQLEQQLAVARQVRDVIGDPSAVGGGIILRGLGATELARTYGETLAEARRLANAIDSLRRTWDGIYTGLDNRTSLGREFVRQEEIYRRYAVVEKAADNLTTVQEESVARAKLLQDEIGTTLDQLRVASTQSEVDKLTAKLAALYAQLAHVDAERQAGAEQLRVQAILNENQSAKERQDLLERQQAEQRQSLAIAGAWQGAMTLQPTNYRQP